MLTTTPAEQFETLKAGVIDQITRTFPVTDRRGGVEIRVRDLGVRDAATADDIQGQAQARNAGRTWSTPVTGTLEFVDTATGKTLLTKPGHVLAQIPKMTRHATYIIGGAEKTVSNQWRLRNGVYVRETQKPGEFKAQFQLAKGKPFDIHFGTDSKLVMKLGTREVPLYAVMQGLGVSDAQMKETLGPKLFEESKAKVDVSKGLRSFYKGWKGEDLDPKADPASAVRAALEDTRMDPVIAHANLGVEHDKVSPEVLLAAAKKLADVATGKTRPDPIDSLRYKELWTAADHFADRIAKSTTEIHGRVQKALEKGKLVDRIRSGDADAVREVVMPDLFQRPMASIFTTSLASNAKQTNPLSMLSDRSIVTIMGPGGIQNEHQITSSNTAVDPSHVGFIDPVFTPESNAGVSVHLTSGTRIVDRKPVTRLFNVKTGKIEDVDAARAAVSNVVLPDQVKWTNGVPAPLGNKVRMADRHGDMRDDLGWRHADYVLLNPAQVFATESNLVPYMASDSPHRSTMSARHMAQAISIVGREPPLVQTEAGQGTSFEKVIGSTFLAHKAPVAGTVKEVRPDGVVIQDAKGKKHTVGLYDHYPLNHDKAMLHSTPLVKPGDRVKPGDALADHNYAKDGHLAIGTNVRVAYLADGFNHEDGITISESAQKKLSSEHLYKPSMYVSDNHVIGKKEFLFDKPAVYKPEQLKNIGDDGVIKPGTRVKPGDPLVLALSVSSGASTTGKNRQISRLLKGDKGNAAVVWDSDYEGEVVRINRKGNVLEAHVKTFEPAQVGSKLSTRHSAKGIVTRVVPDDEMPRDSKGKHVEMLINPVSVPGRMNPGQIFETVAGKIAEKTGKPYVIKNFETGTNYIQKLESDLKKHGLTATEKLTDPKTGRVLGDVTVGPHYVFQLEHQIDKKTHVRSGGRFRALKGAGVPMLGYDTDTETPQGGGHHGAQSLGLLGSYGALAAGMRDNLREMQTLKSDLSQAQELWGALSNGTMIPAPKVPFAYKKFEAMLRGLGVNVDKTANEVRLMPGTDAETRALSNGALKNPALTTKATEAGSQPVKGGLYDREITGGPSGPYWSHIELVEPMPHPLHEKSIAYFLGIKSDAIPDILAGKANIPGGATGPAAIKSALSKLNIQTEMKALKAKLADPRIKGNDLDKVNRAYKALQVLEETGKHPKDAWTIQALPVLPPVYRVEGTLPDGTQRLNDLNKLYRRVGITNESLRTTEKRVPYKMTLDSRAGLYGEIKHLFGTVPKDKKALDLDIRGTKVREVSDKNETLNGILHSISGDSPKDGFFQDKLLGKKQDYTARVTIVADPGLSAGEIGVPKKVALELFRPMVARRLQHLTAQRDPLKIHEMISKKDPVAIKALEAELEHRPVMLKRDPVLHQYGLVGQKVRLTNDAAVKVSPLILPPIGGDIDGDAVVLSVPITQGAVEEVKRIMPEARNISGSSGSVLFKPANEAALALYRMSIGRGDKTNLPLKSHEEAEKAFLANKIDLNHKINIPGVGVTTLGRLRIAKVVPEQYRKDILTNLNAPFDSKYQDRILKETARNASGAFLPVADRLAQLGFKMAFESGHSVTLADLKPLTAARDSIISKAEKAAEKAQAAGKHDEATKVWVDATKAIHAAYEKHYEKKPTNVSDMAKSGIKAKREQFQGLVMAPMLVEDYLGRPSKVPVTKSYSEGVDVGGYFLQSMGARRGLIQKTKSTAEPGYLTKRMVWATTDQPITAQDCGAQHGVLLSTKEKDVVDRHLAAPVTLAGKTFGANTVVTPEMLAAAEKSKVDKLLVRSPLKCRMPHGICSKCMGLHPSGKEYNMHDNVGIIAAQALGERAAQLMLKQTHGGGIMSIGAASASMNYDTDLEGFPKVERLLDAAKPGAASAILAPGDGVVTKVEPAAKGGWNVYLSGRAKPLHSRQKPHDFVKPGYQAKRGEQLTAGDANIHHILETKGLDAVQNHLAKEIGNIYGKEGVLRRHVELLVRNTAGTVKVTDPGAHPHFIRGDHVMKPVLDEVNRTVLAGKAPVKYEPTLIAVGQHPTYMQKDWMARMQSERLTQSVAQAVQQGQRSRITGLHPIPGLAHGATFGRPQVH